MVVPDGAAGILPVEDPTAACYCCSARGISIFYEVENVPVLVSSQERPFGAPMGDIRLGFCKSCGFIENVSFDPGMLDNIFEETQSFSPTFNAFARDLARRLIDKYDLREREVLEIGCGRGEFLVLLCELGGNRGIGIDPAYVPELIPSGAAERITFLREYFSEKHDLSTIDFLCCRHTLEHIQQTGEFLRSVRRSLGQRRDVVVFFEVPDVARILREQAFWDINYEHCSYFSLGSLARLFRSCGFELLDLKKAFDDQYLLIDARPGDFSAGPSMPGEDDLEALTCEVDEFVRSCAGKLERWRRKLQELRGQGRRTVIWGGGAKGVAFLTTLGVREEIEFAVDINPTKQGMYMPGTGQRIVPPEFLREYRPDVVIVMNPIYSGEIQQTLSQINVTADVYSV